MTGEVTRKQHAFGRSLSDFAKLNDAERKVIAAARAGHLADFGEMPETDSEKQGRIVSAGLVRFLALGGDDAAPVHEEGVNIRGAVIDGPLNFEGCRLNHSLLFRNCELNDTLTLRWARTQSVSLGESRCRNIDGDGVEISGALFLYNKFVATGVVRLNGAKIFGPLVCDGGRFEGRDPNGHSLDCDGIQVDGYVFLREGFAACGNVNFLNATIGSDVACVRGHFGATVKANNAGDGAPTVLSTDRPSTALVIVLARANVQGTLWLGPGADFRGSVSLVGARIGRIVDAVTMDTKRHAVGPPPEEARDSPTFLDLDGLTYDRFGESTNQNASARIAFLHLQRPRDLGEDFRPQPWMQMVKVLRDTGHVQAAREVAILYEDERRRAGVIASKAGRFLHWLYGLLVGYGHRPMQLLRITFALWLICAAVYFSAAELGVMAPTNPRVFYEPKHASCRPENGGNWATCATAPYEYTTFNPWVYSLDLMLPFVDLQQDRDWAPMVTQPCAVTKSIWVTDVCRRSVADARANVEIVTSTKPAYWILGTLVAFVMWFEILFGWAASLLLAAVLSGLAKRME